MTSIAIPKRKNLMKQDSPSALPDNGTTQTTIRTVFNMRAYGEVVWEVADAVLRRKTSIKHTQLHATQKFGIAVSSEMLDRIVWLVSPQRERDLSADIMDHFRRVAHGGEASLLDSVGLPDARKAMIRDILERPAQYGNRNSIVMEEDQMAMMFHMARLGAARLAAAALFPHGASDYACNEAYDIAREHYQMRATQWKWDHPEKYPLPRLPER
jgi:hypothetical protein